MKVYFLLKNSLFEEIKQCLKRFIPKDFGRLEFFFTKQFGYREFLQKVYPYFYLKKRFFLLTSAFVLNNSYTIT